ncbi:hypothetical protein B0920_14770 [Massilia sp. KIM]|uniref:hypothetical protein n=1 Tax=Massilia sp. KIM TaxID=1955422 RepID=UPI00098EC747|nr:hypothetical protein [Massilia sp. KIM]OON64532.1 hypothetical protein B0920_14770 [Massilia sp. KIM]
MRTSFFLRGAWAAAGALVLSSCSPTYNWRDYSSEQGAYKVLFPAKPSSFTRTIDLNGMKVDMTMTAAEVDGATFAVGAGTAADEGQALAALPAMRQALLRNIGVQDTGAVPDAKGRITVDATGRGNGQTVKLDGRFEAKGRRFYQVIVLGKSGTVPPEQVEQFLSSFAPL